MGRSPATVPPRRLSGLFADVVRVREESENRRVDAVHRKSTAGKRLLLEQWFGEQCAAEKARAREREQHAWQQDYRIQLNAHMLLADTAAPRVTGGLASLDCLPPQPDGFLPFDLPRPARRVSHVAFMYDC